MLDTELAITLGRLAMVGFVMVAPALLFLGLCRGLERLRDDALVRRWMDENETAFDPADMNDVIGVMTGGIRREKRARTPGHCPACGTGNPSHVRFCGDCLGKLPRNG